ncbi:MAG: ATP-binding protein [Pseudomonadota bacterium]
MSRVRRLTRRSAIRLTLRLLLVFAAVATLASAGTYWLVEREITRLADARLEALRDEVLGAMETETPFPEPGFGQNVLIVENGTARGQLPFAVPDRPDGVYYHDEEGERPEFRYLIHTAPNGARIIIAENVERQDELLEILSGGLQLALIGALVAGAVAGMLFSRREQKRLDVIGDGLAEVAKGHLSRRIVLPGPADDLALLSERINATTDRLERSVELMRTQSSNIAHDLRTPLARLRATIETSLIALTEEARPVDAEVLGEALEQIDRIIGTFNALLKLSRLESGAGREGFALLDLKTLAADLGAAFEPVAEAAGQTLAVTIGDPAKVRGDRDLLVQLIGNLVQNAVRHGARGQRVTLSVQGRVLTVGDQGPGIPLAERSKVLQPLYQLESARQGEGFGLGLSIVSAICDLCGASLSLSDGEGGRGLVVTVRFPQSA